MHTMLRSTTAVVGLVLLCSHQLATATLRGSTSTRALQQQEQVVEMEVDRASIGLPGVSIDLPSPTSPVQIGTGTSSSSSSDSSDSTDIGGVVIGNNSISIGGQTIVSWGSGSTANSTCDNLPSTSLREEPSCETALPIFYNATTEDYFNDMTDRQRKRVLDDFCRTRCGQVFTARTVATRLKCDNRRKPDDQADVDQGIIPSQNISVGEGITVGIPGLINITLPGTRSNSDGNKNRLLEVDPKLEPEFSDDYPGLFLGCVKDSNDNKYCATKRADPKEGECDFYRSCCYAELNAITSIDLQKATYIETRCPGSTLYRLGSLCTA